MLVTPINDSQSFQARIKINKSNIGKILTTASLGTVGAASLAAQTDFDAAISQSTVPSTAYEGSTVPFINKLQDSGTPAGQLSAAAISVPLTVQGSSLSGLKFLDAASDNVLSNTIDNIDFNNEKVKELGLANLMASTVSAAILSERGLDSEILATLGTTAVPMASSDITALSEAYDKTKSNKKIPS